MIFEMNKVNFAYPMAEPVLRDIDLNIQAGQRICILGANGCGKSTLLKILAGLLTPQSGEFSAFGHIVEADKMNKDEAKAYHRRIGYVFQDSDVQLFCGNVMEELAFGPMQLGLSHEEILNQVRLTAESLGIAHLLNQAPYHLSGGEKKKVAIASTLIMDPDVLIMDEPTNDLDPRSQTWLLQLLRSFTAKGKTLIFSTHNLELVPHVSDRAILFSEDHKIVADQKVRDLLSNGELLRNVNLVDEHFHTHPWDFE